MTRLGVQPVVHESAELRDCRLGAFVEIAEGCRLQRVEMGDYSYADRFADIADAEIGRFVSIAAFTRINPGNHPTWRASAHHFTYRAASYFEGAEDEAAFFEWRSAQACVIGHDAWIGHGAIILPGRSVGVGAVVGAGAVVSRDVAPYSIVAGAPAAELRKRFDAPISERLLALGWWGWSHQALRAALADFRALPVEAFLEKYEDARPGGDARGEAR